ncbi:MAG: hypothetical protein KC442_23035 [Thermomicrobiales bacterium]|nr:hypothetical protein [Thermomicrobiales bacterium]
MRRHLVDYLDGRETLDEFTDWIVGAVWGVEQYGEPDAARLGYAIELAMAERTSGLLSREELDAELRALAPAAPEDIVSTPAPALRRGVA